MAVAALLWSRGTGGYSEVECDNSMILERDEFGQKSEVFVKDEAKLVSSVGDVEWGVVYLSKSDVQEFSLKVVI